MKYIKKDFASFYCMSRSVCFSCAEALLKVNSRCAEATHKVNSRCAEALLKEATAAGGLRSRQEAYITGRQEREDILCNRGPEGWTFVVHSR